MKALGGFAWLLFTASFLTFAAFVFSQDKSEVAAKEISGNIDSINAENSSLVIMQLKGEANQSYEDVVIYVEDSTSIEKNNQAANLSDLESGEEISAEYTTNETGQNVAGHIWVND